MARPLRILCGSHRTAALQWTPQRLAAEYSSLSVTVSVNLPHNGVPYSERAAPFLSKMRVGEFIAALHPDSTAYMNQMPLKLFPALMRDVGFISLRPFPIRAMNLWVGAATRSGLHFDQADNLFAQIYVSKRVLLVNPRNSRRLYGFPDAPSKSQVDPDHPDLRKFPAFADCAALHCTLVPGEFLYIPRGWWHFIASDGISISANCWHGRSLTSFQRRRMYLRAAGPKLLSCWLRVVSYSFSGQQVEIFRRLSGVN
jgi:lysine-specific demethylase 8